MNYLQLDKCNCLEKFTFTKYRDPETRAGYGSLKVIGNDAIHIDA